MSRSAYLDFSSVKCLQEAWDEMYRNSSRKGRLGFGIDRISIAKFNMDQTSEISKLSKHIRRGDFKFNSLVPRFVPKPDGKDRVICIPTVPDRLVQRALCATLYKHGYTFNNSISYGFVKGKSSKQAAKHALKLRSQFGWVYKTDISSFFDNLPRGELEKEIRRKIRLPSLHSILVSATYSEVYCETKRDRRRLEDMGIVEGVGVRQGMPLSPLMANLYLSDFDREVERRGFHLVRYADDIIAFASSESECRRVKDFCENFISGLGFDLKEEKSSVADPGEAVEFLGLGLAMDKGEYRLIVTDKQLRAVKHKLAQYADIDFCLRRGVNLRALVKRLDGVVDGYAGVYDLCHNRQALADVLESAKNKTLRDIFHINFGINYKELSRKQKKFLSLD